MDRRTVCICQWSKQPYLQQYLECESFVYELLLLETRQHVLHKLLSDHIATSAILCSSTGHKLWPTWQQPAEGHGWCWAQLQAHVLLQLLLLQAVWQQHWQA